MAAPITIYGIKNCDTMKKARKWLDENAVAYSFHDFKKNGVTAAQLAAWSKSVGWEKLLNKVGTTFRKLPDADKLNIDEARAIALMVDQPSMIKRPVLDMDGSYLVGFKADDYARVLAQAVSL